MGGKEGGRERREGGGREGEWEGRKEGEREEGSRRKGENVFINKFACV